MTFLKSWRRKRALAKTRIDEALWQRVLAGLPFLRGLPEADLARLRELTVLFLAEKEMHGAAGFELTDEVCLSIALQACLPILNLGLDAYDDWVGVIVYAGEFKARRDYFIPELNRLGLTVPVMPDGAFYAYADCTAAVQKLGLRAGQPDGTGGSWDFAFELMQRAHLAVTPGRDFGQAAPEKFIRFSTASSMAHLQEAVARLEKLLG